MNVEGRRCGAVFPDDDDLGYAALAGLDRGDERAGKLGRAGYGTGVRTHAFGNLSDVRITDVVVVIVVGLVVEHEAHALADHT